MDKQIRCGECVHCISEDKICRPNSVDCKPEYSLSESDIHDYRTYDCDFYKMV